MRVKPNQKLTHEQANAINDKMIRFEELKSVNKRLKLFKSKLTIADSHIIKQQKIIDRLTNMLKSDF